MAALRVSSYIIPVALEDGKYMLLHGYSGAIDIVGEKIATYLMEHDITEDLPFDEEIQIALKQRGYITEKSKIEEDAYVKRMASALHRKESALRSSFTFVVTYNCNFRCPYCFEKMTVENALRATVFTKEMVDRAYRAIEEIQPEKKLRSSHIELFGGEPLLRENHEIVAYIVEQGLHRGFSFSAVTNGYDLDVFLDLLSPKKIKQLQITIDGTEQMHNSKRIHCLGYPTFQKIVNNIGLALRQNIQITIRFNTDRTNIGELNQLKELFDNLHYTNNPNFSIDSARLMNYDENLKGQKLQDFFSPREFIAEHENLGFKYGCHDYGTYSKLYRAIKEQKPLPYHATFCASQVGSYVLDPLGKIYPCWEFIGKEEFQIGDYSASSIRWNQKRLDEWQQNDVTMNTTCRTCTCALLCGGGCLAHNRKKHRCVHMQEIILYAARKAYHNINLKIRQNEENK